ncbi:N-acetylmuramoyl-L-alanine amidase [Piscinibacter sakaiensis]
MTACAGPGGLAIDRRYSAASQDSRVQFIVLHYTDGELGPSLDILTRGPVSSHYLVDRDPPTIYQLVDETRRAYHAGASSWEGVTALNASSIGIEIVNDGYQGDRFGPYQPYPPAQIDAVIALVRDIAQRHGVRPNRIVGHSDIAPTRKQDPGPMFPWRRLADAGLVPWPDEAQVAAERPRFEAALPPTGWFQERLARHGFALPQDGLFDEATRDALSAFQMKYRPARYDGQPDAETAALLEVVNRPGGLWILGGDGRREPFLR